jgi:hypothetical protein
MRAHGAEEEIGLGVRIVARVREVVGALDEADTPQLAPISGEL